MRRMGFQLTTFLNTREVGGDELLSVVGSSCFALLQVCKVIWIHRSLYHQQIDLVKMKTYVPSELVVLSPELNKISMLIGKQNGSPGWVNFSPKKFLSWFSEKRYFQFAGCSKNIEYRSLGDVVCGNDENKFIFLKIAEGSPR